MKLFTHFFGKKLTDQTSTSHKNHNSDYLLKNAFCLSEEHKQKKELFMEKNL